MLGWLTFAKGHMTNHFRIPAGQNLLKQCGPDGVMACRWLWFLGLVLAWYPALAAQPPVIHGDKIVPHWFAGADGVTNQFWYDLDQAGGGHEFIRVDAAAGRRGPAFDHARVAAALTQLTGHKATAGRLDFQAVDFAPDGKTVTLAGLDGSWRLDLADYSLTVLSSNAPEADTLPAESDWHASRASEVETRVVFVNRLAQPVLLFWIDNAGHQVAYGEIPAGERFDQHTFAGHVWLVTTETHETIAAFTARREPAMAVVGKSSPAKAAPARRRDRKNRKASEAASASVVSPDDKWSALVRGDNLFLHELGTTNEIPLSADASRDDSYARHSEYASGMDLEDDSSEVSAPEVYWSPDSKHLVAIRHRPGTPREVHLIESSPEDQVQPKMISIPYLKAGDTVPVNIPHLFAVETKAEIPVSNVLFTNPWSIDGFQWEADSTRFTFQYNQRGHQALRVLAVAADSGAVTAIVNETNQTFIDYSGKYFCERVDEAGELIWMSERDGWNHLYLYDAKTGAVKNQITKGEWVVRSVERVDHANRQIWFTAGGIVPGQDPYFEQCCRVNFDGSGLTVLTAGNGTHTAQFSPDRKYLIDTWSRVDALPVTELRSCQDGRLVCPLETAAVSGRLVTPAPFTAKGRDGVTDIYGVIWRPADFNPRKKYAVIEYIYAGPHSSFVPKAFRPGYSQQKLADEGYIVVQMDGMGTANRSKAFHDVCWKNLKDAGFPDRILWIRAAAKQFPGFDLARVGIYGTSAGGQDALRALLDHGDFYRAGIADSGCYDNRMDKIWWNEQWMGWPVDDSYVRSSCVTDAHKLTGKLLLMAGELDRNVDPSSTLQVVNALVKADKNFELFIMPGMGHGVLSTAYGWRRLEGFFARELGGPR